jgi:hypothetical protein
MVRRRRDVRLGRGGGSSGYNICRPAHKQPKAHIVPLETFSGYFIVEIPRTEIPMTDSMASDARSP